MTLMRAGQAGGVGGGHIWGSDEELLQSYVEYIDLCMSKPK